MVSDMSLIQIEMKYYLDGFFHKGSTLVIDPIYMTNNWKGLDSHDLNIYFKIFPILLESKNEKTVKLGNYSNFKEINEFLSKFVKEGIPELILTFEFE